MHVSLGNVAIRRTAEVSGRCRQSGARRQLDYKQFAARWKKVKTARCWEMECLPVQRTAEVGRQAAGVGLMATLQRVTCTLIIHIQ